MENINNNLKVSSYQALLLIILYRIIIAFTYLPIVNTVPRNQDIWIVLLLSIPYTIILFWPLMYLGNKFKGLNLIQYTEKILGRFFGKIFNIYYILFLFLFCIILVSTLVEILNTTMFLETPTYVTTAIIIITCAYVSYKGLESIARGAEIFVPFILLTILLFVVLSYNNYDFTVLLPILKDSTFKELSKGSLDRSIKFSDALILAMLSPHLEKKEDLNGIFVKSVIYSIIIIIILVVSTQAVLGIEYPKHINFPFFTFSRLVNLLDFIQRIELLIVIALITGNIGKISGYMYFASVAFAQTLNKDNNKVYIVPISIMVFIITLVIKDRRSILAVGDTLQSIILITSFIALFILPLITMIVYFFRKDKFSDIKNN